MSADVPFPVKRVPLFDEQQVRHYLQMKRENMFSYTLRDLVLPPIRDTRSFHVTRDDRLMERAGVGARSARGLPWYETEKESFQHHAEYLKRLSKLREELIQQEQNNLANALDRLRMRSYGREYVYSQPQKEKKTPRLRHSAQSDIPAKRNSLLTTFEKFQRMRPKKNPPTIMPVEGKSLIDAPVSDRIEKHERRHGNHGNQKERDPERSVDENVRVNLQRLTTHSIPSIPRKGRNSTHRDIVLESSSYRRSSNNDANNSNMAEDRIAQMQKQKQKLMKLRHEAREAEKVKLMPQSFRIDTLSDEDRMNLEKLKDYYCIYYVPAPSTSPVNDENDLHIHLPKIGTNNSCNHSFVESENGGSTFRSQKSNGLSANKAGFKIMTDFPIPPCTCNCTCRMYVSGNKVETPFDQVDYSISKTHATNNPNMFSSSKTSSGNSQKSRNTEKSWPLAKKSTEKHERNRSRPNSHEKKRIRVDMPAIVYNTVQSPEPASLEPQSGLVKAFKQKELRQKELSNLMEDVRELNKRTESLSGTVS